MYLLLELLVLLTLFLGGTAEAAGSGQTSVGGKDLFSKVQRLVFMLIRDTRRLNYAKNRLIHVLRQVLPYACDSTRSAPA